LIDRFSSEHLIASGAAAGMKIFAPHADPEFGRGTYELPIQKAISENLSPGDVFFDVGANIGFFSLVAARQVAAEGSVYSFEPVPSNVALIRRNAELNSLKTIHVFPEAVGATSARAELVVAKHIGGAVLASAGRPPDAQSRMTVDVVTLDDAMSKHGLRPPTLMKIDVEGAEIDVLRGATGILRVHKPKLIYEIDDATEAGIQRKSQEIEAFMTTAGYSIQPLPNSYDMDGWHVVHYLAHANQD
jgi:FkbM family methyltransferase